LLGAGPSSAGPTTAGDNASDRQSSRVFASLINVLSLRVHQVVAETPPEQWLKRAAPGTNLMAFTLWHVVRAMDSGIHMGLRGIPELIDDASWRERAWAQSGVGVGLSHDETDRLAMLVVPNEILDYADSVRASASEWPKTLSDADLEAENSFIEHAAARLAYAYPAYAAEVAWMEGRPVWAILAISVCGHCWAHLAEIETLMLGILRFPSLQRPWDSLRCLRS
jgi:hypothetical protein